MRLIRPRSPRSWQAALGWRRTSEEDDEIVLEPPEGSAEDGGAPDLLFLRVPEKKTVKNRVHLDLRPEDQAAEVARLEGLGARRVDIGQGSEVSWVVMADPEGNEFDVLSPADGLTTTPWVSVGGRGEAGRRTRYKYSYRHTVQILLQIGLSALRRRHTLAYGR